MAITTLVTRQRVVAAKIETTPGTAISIAAADATIPTYDMALKYTIPPNLRPSPGSSSSLPHIPGARSGECTFQTHLSNSGTVTAPVWASTHMTACGMALNTATLNTVTGSASANTLTIGLYQDGRLKTISGAAGGFVIKGVAGNPITIDWTFTGKYEVPTATALITPTYAVPVIPRFAGATITINSVAYTISEFELDSGNTTTLAQTPACKRHSIRWSSAERWF